MEVEFILYVQDQARSRQFYAIVLDRSPSLDVPGMTEFELGPGCKLGLMPAHGIAKIIVPPMAHPAQGHGIPRCELYLRVPDHDAAAARVVAAGGLCVDDAKPRDWGDRVSYWADSDGHVLALAQCMG